MAAAPAVQVLEGEVSYAGPDLSIPGSDAQDLNTPQIGSRARQVVDIFETILHDVNSESEFTRLAFDLDDQASRLKLWGRNIGAFQDAESKVSQLSPSKMMAAATRKLNISKYPSSMNCLDPLRTQFLAYSGFQCSSERLRQEIDIRKQQLQKESLSMTPTILRMLDINSRNLNQMVWIGSKFALEEQLLDGDSFSDILGTITQGCRTLRSRNPKV
ncbi:hypothetical protein ABW19_dt0204617 [Dactylella cylindrospora]|nr:hypothetical protein ABW19_dt0204617 [Dactylella cylindrospora]